MTNSRIQLVLAGALLLGIHSAAFAKTAASAAKEQEAKLIAVLRSDAAQKEKADACRELAHLGTKEAVAALAVLLGDEQLSHMARYGLETIPNSAVDKALRAALPTLKGRQLAGVVTSLGVRRDADAVKPVAKLLTDADPEVSTAARQMLQKLKSVRDNGSGIDVRLVAEMYAGMDQLRGVFAEAAARDSIAGG